MRLEERCKCGAEMVIVYDAGTAYSTRSQLEKSEAHKQLDNFRRRHKPCLSGQGTIGLDAVNGALGAKIAQEPPTADDETTA